MAQIIGSDLSVNDLIRILQGYADQGKGEMQIDIYAADEGLFFDIEKIKVSDSLDLYLVEQE